MAMDCYRRILDGYNLEYTAQEASDNDYVEQMRGILSAVPCVGIPREPSSVMGMVFLGSTANAENMHLLGSLGITYILNCAGGSYVRFKRIREMYGPETGILGYDEIPADDDERFNIRPYLDRANGFIDFARSRGGRVLIHCPGVSRSGVVAIAYLIHTGKTLLEATKLVKDKRRCALNNEGFMFQLTQYARDRGMLDSDVKSLTAPRYYTHLNRYRIMTSHLPTII